MQSAGHATRQRRQRLKDVALYIAISTIVIVFVVVGAEVGLSYEWIAVSLLTVLIFGYFIAVNRSTWNRAFWIFTGLCLVFHVAVLVPASVHLLSPITHGKVWWIVGGTYLEAAFLFVLKDMILQDRISE